MASTDETAVRSYLLSVRDPSALRDRDAIAELNTKLEQADDELERLQLRQQLLDSENPSLDRYEDAFVEHAKAWAERTGITADAFLAEGACRVLRRAGFRGGTGGGGGRRTTSTRTTSSSTRSTSARSRVSADEVREAMPSGTFTVKDLQERSGASAAVVRRVILEEVEAGNVSDEGSDPDHTGPGRAPKLYRSGS